MIALSLIPLAAWLLLLGTFRRSEEGWRGAFLSASAVWGVAVAVSTETLGALHAVTFTGLLTAWTGITVGAAVWFLSAVPKEERPSVGLLYRDLTTAWAGLPAAARILAGLTAVPVAVTLMIALLSPPNNWDSMVYHMSRVMHWLQNRTVAFYPAHNTPQLFFPPWAEYVILLFQGLTGGDRLANAVQWFSMAGSVAGASLIARRLGAGKTGQVLTALIVATLPMGILQATNTKNDYVLAFWAINLAYQAIALREDASWRRTLLFGGSLGLAVMTKGTSYLFAFPLVLWACAVALRRHGGAVLLRLSLAGLLALVLNAGHYWRTTAVFGDPLARTDMAYTTNETHGPGAVVSNLIRNYTLHFNTGSAALNGTALSFAAGLHDLFGLNENDPRTTLYGPFQYQSSFGHVLHEDVAGNLPHALLLLPVTLLPLALKRFRTGGPILPYLTAAVSAVLLFCLLLKWQPWNSRLHLPLFILWAPLAGCVLERLQTKRAAAVVAAALLLYAAPYLILNISRPLVERHLAGPMSIPSILSGSRFDAYFNNLPQLRDQMVRTALVARERGCTQVGMDAGGSHNGEYLLWVTLKEAGVWPVRIESINVDNRSASVPRAPFTPCIAVKL